MIEIIDLLKENQDVFSGDYKYLKGLVEEMGEMKIDILPKVTPIKKRPYKLAHKYKEIVKIEIDNMLIARLIYLVDQSEWASPMVVQPKKHDPKKLRVCVEYRWLSKDSKIDPFPTPFANEIPNEVNVIHLQMGFQNIIRYQLQRRIIIKQPLYVNLDLWHT